MDHNANLQEQERLLTHGVETLRLLYGIRWEAGSRRRLRELRHALASWLASGGFEPDWSACPNAARYFVNARKEVTL